MKKYILLLTPLTLLTTARAQQELAPSIATLGYAFDDLAAQLGKAHIPEEAPRKPVLINNVNTLTDAGVLGALKQTGGTLAQQKERKLLALDTMNGLEIFVQPRTFTTIQKNNIKNAITEILNANSLAIVTALRIYESLGEPKKDIYDIVTKLFANKVNTTADDRGAGFREDVAEARAFYNLIAPEVAAARQSNSAAAQNFVQAIETLKQKLDSLKIKN